MKKVLFNFIVLFIGCRCAYAQTYYWGDVNHDGEIDISDVSFLINVILGKGDKEEVEIENCEITGKWKHGFVDLGLSVKWATCNIGADKPEESGLYFACGATTGYTNDTSDGHSFDWSTTPFNGGYSYYSEEFWNKAKSTAIDENGYLLPVNDAAFVNWGHWWHLPSYQEWQELRTMCTWTWCQQNGVYGYKVEGTNGNNIFLPAGGYRLNTELKDVGLFGNYWSSLFNEYYSCGNSYVGFGSVNYFWINQRYVGRNVRPVCR